MLGQQYKRLYDSYLDSRTKRNAVLGICKYLHRSFVSEAFAWSSIEEPFDLCKLSIGHG